MRLIREFQRDERGIALILVSIMLPVIIGFALLVIDMSRANNLHNDLQKAADAFALAAAAELDGTASAITRAEHALQTLVSNKYYFSDHPEPQALERAGVTRRFLTSLPETSSTGTVGDALPIPISKVIADEVKDAHLARYVEITVRPVQFRSIFPASFLTGNNADNVFSVGVTAVAGFKSSVCDYTPVFICNPYEMVNGTNDAGGFTLEEAAQRRDLRRRQILLRSDGFYMPGNFAFLESPFGNGANELGAMLASEKPLGCYSKDGVDTKPGQNTGKVKDGINTRFGLNTSYSNAPAQNVRMGAKNMHSCTKNPTFETDPGKGIGLEPDACHLAKTACPYMGGRMGPGDWNSERYWATNHPTRGSLPEALVGSTRYEMYRHEIDPDGNPKTNDSIVADIAKGGETGVPQCGTPVSVPDRRILYGAILDCKAIVASGRSFSGKLEGLPVHAFASFFITEPIKTDKDILVELVDITGKGGRGTLDNFLRDEVQLFR